MADFGMQMPGGRAKQRPSVNVYTALMFAASVALAVALGVVWFSASAVGPGGNALGLQDPDRIDLAGS